MTNLYKIITHLSEIDEIISYCKATKYCSFDIETNGKPYYEPEGFITILGISFQPGSSYIIPLKHEDSPFKEDYLKILNKLGKELLENPNIIKVAYNVQFEMCWMRRYGIELKGRVFDAMLAKHLLNEERPNDLGFVSGLLYPAFADFKDETEKLARKYGWDKIPMKPLCDRNALDTDLTLRLMLYFEPKLIALGLYKLFRNLTMMMARNLSETSYGGFDIDMGYLTSLNQEYLQKLTSLKEEMLNLPRFKRYEVSRLKKAKNTLISNLMEELEELGKDPIKNKRTIATREVKIKNYQEGKFTTKKELDALAPFNPQSLKQLADFFFYSKKGLKLKILAYTFDKKTKKETSNPSLAEDTLKLLSLKDKSQFIEKLLLYNKLEHIHSTYIKGMLERVSTNSKAHTSFLIHGTVTGRLSSVNPNLQNIPRGTTASDIKKMFKAPPGHVILEVDYSQAELRLVAELAKEEVMIDIFKRGYNIHVATACKTNGVLDKYDDIRKILKDENHPDWLFWEKEKKRAKLINFGILYGQTAKKLSQELSNAMGREVSFDEAQKFIDEWYKGFPKVKKWISGQHKKARTEGYVTNLFGRRRRLPNAQFTNDKEAKASGLFGYYLEALRQSVNAPIQGASSDMTQFASVIIREKVLKGELPRYIRQLYTVHDSIGYSIKIKDLAEVIPKIIAICANPELKDWFGVELKYVNMKVSPEVGLTWGSLEEYEQGKDYTHLLNTK